MYLINKWRVVESIYKQKSGIIRIIFRKYLFENYEWDLVDKGKIGSGGISEEVIMIVQVYRMRCVFRWNGKEVL